MSFPCFFVEYSPYQKMFQTQVAYINELYFILHTSFDEVQFELHLK